MKIRFRYVEEGEYPEVPTLPGPMEHGEFRMVVLQEMDGAGNWRDVPIKTEDEA